MQLRTRLVLDVNVEHLALDVAFLLDDMYEIMGAFFFPKLIPFNGVLTIWKSEQFKKCGGSQNDNLKTFLSSLDA